MRQEADPVRLTEWTSCGGCAAKWGAGVLQNLVDALPLRAMQGDLLVGLDPPDDAAVLRLSEHVALVSTIDFFPPLVDDPDDFGAIAAANACSDIFAMGGEVRVALNVAAFPEDLPTAVIARILAAAATTVAEAGGVTAGGHTIRNAEPIFGLAVQGTVHPDRIWTKAGGRPGQVVVLSKPLGTGIALGSADPEAVAAAVASMRRLNRAASQELAVATGVAGPGAVTDVTGFGLAGHACEVAQRSGVILRLRAPDLPLLVGVGDAIAAGVRTGGDARNRAAFAEDVELDDEVGAWLGAVIYDPQTSGGLLATVTEAEARELVEAGWWRIGLVEAGGPGLHFEG